MRNEPLRNPAVANALERALAGGGDDELKQLLCRFSGLPGPRPNWSLAWAVGSVLAGAGSRADHVLRSLTASASSERGTREFLPIVAACTWATKLAARGDPDPALRALRGLAEDTRHLVRDSVVAALADAGATLGDELVDRLASWMSDYLPACVALEAIARRGWLDAVAAPANVVSRLDEAFSLAEGAPRAAQRSQGYRALVSTLPAVVSAVMNRFPDAVVRWLEEKASTDHVELREALAQIARRSREAGHGAGALRGFADALDASAPPRRDPRTYVGPTRKRGGKRR